MIRNLLWVVVIGLFTLTVLPAHADKGVPPPHAPPGYRAECLHKLPGGGCRTWTLVLVAKRAEKKQVSQPGNGDGGGPPPAPATPRECFFGQRKIPCTDTVGSWSHAAQAWCSKMVPQPPFTDPAWGNRTDGAIYVCTRPNGSLIPDASLQFTRWLDGTAAQPTPDPRAIAQRLLTSIGITAIDLGIQPRGDTTKRMSYVNWNMWLWADNPTDTQFGTIHSSRTEGGLTVSLTAEATQVVWDLGNGDTISCGKGTPWSMTATNGGRNVESPNCGYTYTEQGTYTVTATTTWDVTWQAGSQSGTLPLSVTDSAEVIVGELQSVNINNP